METTTAFQSTHTPAHHRTLTAIVCSRCKGAGTVPFTPTPGRPILCGDCHRKARARARDAPRIPAVPRRALLGMRWKGHFVHDALERLDEGEEGMPVEQRRAFVEMVFARGSRQGVRSALEFLDTKEEEGSLPTVQADGLRTLIRSHTRRV